jgi:hypothetical protein
VVLVFDVDVDVEGEEEEDLTEAVWFLNLSFPPLNMGRGLNY